MPYPVQCQIGKLSAARAIMLSGRQLEPVCENRPRWMDISLCLQRLQNPAYEYPEGVFKTEIVHQRTEEMVFATQRETKSGRNVFGGAFRQFGGQFLLCLNPEGSHRRKKGFDKIGHVLKRKTTGIN